MGTLADREKSRKFWEHHLEQCRRSGLSQAEYCRKNNLSIKSFGYRKRTLAFESRALSFIEIPLTQPALPEPPSTPIWLEIGESYRIEIERNFDSETLHRLLEVLNR